MTQATQVPINSKPVSRSWHIAAWCGIGVGMVAMFVHVILRMWSSWFPAWYRHDLGLMDRFTEGDSYYTHGPLVLVVSFLLMAVMVLRTRIAVRPQKRLGRMAIVACLLLYLAGCLVDMTVVRVTAWIFLLGAMTLEFWGWAALRRLLFPILFLMFMVPMPTWIIADINLALRLAATQWGVAIANFVGVMAEHSGSLILMNDDKQMVVGNVCSGLRTLISLLAFGAIYAYVCRLRGWWRIGLFAMSIPVALVANCIRIASIVIVAEVWDVPTATGAYHDNSGIVVFVLAFLMMFGLEKLVITAHRWVDKPMKIPPLLPDVRPKGDWRQERVMFLNISKRKLAVLTVLMIALGLTSWWLDRPKASMWSNTIAQHSLPATLVVNDVRLGSLDMPLSESVLTLLNTRDYLNRTYSGLDLPVDVCVVFSKDNPSSTHPPELCLEAGGGDSILANDIDVEGIEGIRSLPCRELVVRQANSMTYFIYTFKYGRSYTSRFGKQHLLVFMKSRITGGASGALIRISTPITGSLEEARQRALDVMRVSMPYLDQSLN